MASEHAIAAMEGFEAAGMTETLVYRPAATLANPTPATRPVQGLVSRGGAEKVPGSPAPVRTVGIVIRVLNHGTPLGITAAELAPGKDRIDVALAAGGAAVTRALGEPAAQDPDWLTLRIQ